MKILNKIAASALFCAGILFSSASALTLELPPKEDGLAGGYLQEEVYDLANKPIVDFVNEARKVYPTSSKSTSIVTTYAVDPTNNNYDVPGPVTTLSWNAVSGASAYTVYVSLSSDFTSDDTIVFNNITGTSTPVYNLLSSKTYYWKAVSNNGTLCGQGSFATSDTVRYLNLPGLKNVRDIGGWTGLNQGLAYRGSKFFTYPASEETKAEFAGRLGVKTEIDFTKASERSGDGAGLGDGVEWINIQIDGYLTSWENKLFGDVLRVFSDRNNYPIYFHCWGGSDRTGTTALMLEGMCGVDETNLEIDFELSSFVSWDDGFRYRYDDSWKVYRSTIDKVKTYGGNTLQEKFENCAIQGFGLTRAEVSNIKSILSGNGATIDNASEVLIPGEISLELYHPNNADVSNVYLNGNVLGYSYKNGILSFETDEIGEGEIAFDDGTVLEFNVANNAMLKMKPGKNIFTGTANALTFSDSNDAFNFTATEGVGVSVVETSAIYGTNNKALQLAVPAQKGTAFYPFIRADFVEPIERPVAVLFDIHDEYLAFQWKSGNTGYINGGWDASINHFVRKTNISNISLLNSFELSCVVVAETWEPRYNYIDNVAVIPYYMVTYDMPAGQTDVIKYVLADDDGNGNIVLEMDSNGVISGIATSYTVDETIVANGGEKAEFLGWALKEEPEKIITSAKLNGEDITLVPVFEGEVERLETYSEQYGELIFKSDLEGNTYNITNATLLGLLHGGDGVAVTYDGNTGYRGYGRTEGYFYPIAWAEGGGFEFAVPGYASTIRYNAGADVLGTVTIVFNAYNEGTSEASWWDYFKQPAHTSDFAWGDLRSAYSCGKAPVGGWNEIVYSNKYITKATTIIGLSQSGRRDVVYGDVAVYVKPLNAFWLADANGKNREFVVVNETKYTFGSTELIKCTGWTDENGEIYNNGEEYALTELAGKTFKPVVAVPKALDVASIRTKGVQGLRYAAFINNSDRSYADSYGFIVAKASDVDTADKLVFNASFDVNGTNKYGVKYISGTAYSKSKGIDRVYSTDGSVFGDFDMGIGTYFTAVLYNIPESSYNTALTMRPYLEKDGVYYYGETVTRSIYEVACDYRENGYSGLDETGRAYVDAILNAVE